MNVVIHAGEDRDDGHRHTTPQDVLRATLESATTPVPPDRPLSTFPRKVRSSLSLTSTPSGGNPLTPDEVQWVSLTRPVSPARSRDHSTSKCSQSSVKPPPCCLVPHVPCRKRQAAFRKAPWVVGRSGPSSCGRLSSSSCWRLLSGPSARLAARASLHLQAMAISSTTRRWW